MTLMLFISNFMLDLFNIKFKKMKKFYLPVFIITVILIVAGIWIYQTDSASESEAFRISEILHVGVIVLLFIFGLFFFIRRIISAQQGVPPEDELSKRITQKASSSAFYISLFLWLGIMYINNNRDVETDLLFGYGIMGMAIVFALSWLFHNFKGVSDA